MALKFIGDKREVIYSAELNNMAHANLNTVLTDCEVSASSPAAMTVDVASGTIFFGNDVITVVASSDTLTIDAESTSNDRIDLIRVDSTGTLSVLKGTASAVPATPDYDPDNYIVLAIITVGNTTTSITSDEIEDIRVLNQGGAGGSAGTFGRYMEEFTAQTTVVVTHNLGDDEPNVFIYDASGVIIEESSITSITANSKNQVTVVFPSSTSGKIIVYGGVGLNNAYYAEDYSSSLTWSVTHNLENKYVNITCYDTSDKVMEPQEIEVTSENTLTITWGIATAGKVVVTGGISTLPSTRGGTSLNYNRITIATTSTVIKAINADRRSILIKNNDSVSIYIGDSSVATSDGYELEAGKSMYLTDNEAIYGIVTTGTANLAYLEVEE